MMVNLVDPQDWLQLAVSAGDEFFVTVARFLPKLVGAIAILVVGWFAASLLRRITKKLLSWSGLLAMLRTHGIDESFHKAGIKGTFGDFVAAFVFWTIIILSIVSATETLGWTVASSMLRDLLAYAPRLLGGALVLVLALLVSKPTRAFVGSILSELNVPFKDSAARLSGWLVVVLGVFIAIDQVGIDLTFLTANIHLVVAGFVAAFVLSFGFGCKSTVANLIAGYYTRQIFQEGQEVFIGKQRAKVKSLNEVSVVFETEKGDLIVPNNQIMTKSDEA
jgi:hypothetical protein